MASGTTTTTPSEVSALQAQLSQLQKELAEKSALLEESKKGGEEGGGGKSETKMLKMKAQMTSKIKSLEKELAELRQVSSWGVGVGAFLWWCFVCLYSFVC